MRSIAAAYKSSLPLSLWEEESRAGWGDGEGGWYGPGKNLSLSGDPCCDDVEAVEEGDGGAGELSTTQDDVPQPTSFLMVSDAGSLFNEVARSTDQPAWLLVLYWVGRG